MPTDIHLVQTSDDIEAVSNLAREIWTSHYTPIIGKSQVDYMLAKFQNTESITNQISEGCEYYLARTGNDYVGYMALNADPVNRKMKISKIYTHSKVRGTGVGNSLLSHIENLCISRNISRLWLTVNKNNHYAISWYKHHGFVVKDDVKVDIGGGFYMDDFVMEKVLQNTIGLK